MLTLFAPAKINVTLEILARRADGYHALRSVMLPIALYDRIEIDIDGDGEPATATRFVSSDAALAADNLVLRAYAASGAAPARTIRLDKRIPVGGGLGGGSSDAAAILRAAMAGSLGERPDCDWLAAAQNLGSDVPFFLIGTGALVEGYGERVTAIGSLPPWWVLVARPHASVATADAYRRLDATRDGGSTPSRPRNASASLAAIDALQRGDFEALVGSLLNDFHDVVVPAYPPIARADSALRAAGATHVLLSGSGSCLFAMFACEADARAVAARVEPGACDALFTVALHHDDAWR